MKEMTASFAEQINEIDQICKDIESDLAVLNEDGFASIKENLLISIQNIRKDIVDFGKPICEAFDCIKNQFNVIPSIILSYYENLSQLDKSLVLISKIVKNPNVPQMTKEYQKLAPMVDHLTDDLENFKANMILMGISLVKNLPSKVKKMETVIPEMEKRLRDLDANLFKAGLAESFKNREKELDNPKKYWCKSLFGCLAAVPIVLCAIEYFFPFDSIEVMISMSIRTPVVISLVWAAWFSSKKYTYLSNIQDDYRYKYDLAMAYQGYSNEVLKLNNSDKLLALLLGSLIENISQNPLDHVRSEPHTPWAETIEPIIDKVGKDK